VSNYERVNLINFGAALNDEALQAIQKEVDADEIKQIMVKVNLDLSKNPYIQCHDIVDKQKNLLLSSDPFVVNLPGLPIACVFIVNEIAAITGKEPTIVFTSRNISGEGYFSEFKFRRLFNLGYEKTVTREKFKNGNG
jgi:hypothetical protein